MLVLALSVRGFGVGVGYGDGFGVSGVGGVVVVGGGVGFGRGDVSGVGVDVGDVTVGAASVGVRVCGSSHSRLLAVAFRCAVSAAAECLLCLEPMLLRPPLSSAIRTRYHIQTVPRFRSRSACTAHCASCVVFLLLYCC